MIRHKNMHRHPGNVPLGYFITFRTYGTWLPGDERGSVTDQRNRYQTAGVEKDPRRVAAARAIMTHEPVLLAAESAALVEETVREVCAHRRWLLHIVRARTNHVHVVVSGAAAVERMMNDFKAWSTRHVREEGYVSADQKTWSEHGSTPYLWSEAQLSGAVEYVRDWQGSPLQRTWDAVLRDIEAREGKIQQYP